MSWLSKWWKDGGKDFVVLALRGSVQKRAKDKALDKLRMLVDMLDKADIESVRRELNAMIKYVEGL